MNPFGSGGQRHTMSDTIRRLESVMKKRTRIELLKQTVFGVLLIAAALLLVHYLR